MLIFNDLNDYISFMIKLINNNNKPSTYLQKLHVFIKIIMNKEI